MIDYIELGKPNQNAYIERFNRSYRTEVLDTWLFRDLDEVREIKWAWTLEYNEERDHDSLGGLTPAEALANARSSTFGAPQRYLWVKGLIWAAGLRECSVVAE